MQKSNRNIDFIFDKIIELVEGGWHQNIMAKNSKGEPVYIEDRDAASFDLYGAFCRVFYLHPNMLSYRERTINAIIAALNATGEKKGLHEFAKSANWHYHVNKFNDALGRSKMEVVRLLQKAKEKANA